MGLHVKTNQNQSKLSTMKLTLFTLAIFTLVIGTCAADSYQNGFITGMMVEKAMPSKKAKPIKYNTLGETGLEEINCVL